MTKRHCPRVHLSYMITAEISGDGLKDYCFKVSTNCHEQVGLPIRSNLATAADILWNLGQQRQLLRAFKISKLDSRADSVLYMDLVYGCSGNEYTCTALLIHVLVLCKAHTYTSEDEPTMRHACAAALHTRVQCTCTVATYLHCVWHPPMHSAYI